jgi:protein-S-isoprenylcysteine O-methyltransferase Ste14
MLLAAFVVFVVLTLVVPLARRPGALALTRTKRPVERVLGASLLAIGTAVAAWCAACSFVSLDSLGVWPHRATFAGGVAFASGIAVIAIAQAQMGSSWRIGIDEQPTGLVTSGLFGVVRNPIYAGMLLGLVGLVLATPSAFTVAVTALSIVLVMVQSRLEEEHLESLHGAEFRKYASKVGRFLPLVGRTMLNRLS